MKMIMNAQARTTTLVFLLAMLAAGCKQGSPVITITDAEAWVSPAFVGVASVFMKIENSGNSDDRLLGARAEIPGVITELHDLQDGKMAKVESISIPAGDTVRLRPARYHIMILKIPKDTAEGSAFDMTLIFGKSGQKKISLKFTPPAPLH